MQVPTFRTRIQKAADLFVESICEIVSTATLEDITESALAKAVEGPIRAAVRTRVAKPMPAPKAAPKALPAKAGARLKRRSPEEIEALVKSISGLLKKKGPMRAEHIRSELGMQSKELPKLLKQGLKDKLLKSKGERRATEYTAAA